MGYASYFEDICRRDDESYFGTSCVIGPAGNPSHRTIAVWANSHCATTVAWDDSARQLKLVVEATIRRLRTYCRDVRDEVIEKYQRGHLAHRQDRLLKVLLRVIGTAGLLAIPFVMVPHSWMDAIHRELGMGSLPDAPVVGYLARSASAFYAILGGLLWTVSFDLRRHRLVLGYIGVAVILFGLAMLAVDFAQGMPIWWSLAEGPANVAFGAAFLWLSWRMDESDRSPISNAGDQ